MASPESFRSLSKFFQLSSADETGNLLSPNAKKAKSKVIFSLRPLRVCAKYSDLGCGVAAFCLRGEYSFTVNPKPAPLDASRIHPQKFLSDRGLLRRRPSYIGS